jgi:thiamine pyrophosphokinase
LKIELPQCRVDFPQIQTEPLVLVAAGRAPSIGWLATIADQYPVWAIDRGVDVCRRAAVTPEFLIGDADSGSATAWHWAQAIKNVVTVKHPVDKDATDLQLALQELGARRPGSLALLAGGWGGRFDHACANVFSLLESERWGVRPGGLVDDAEALFFVFAGQNLAIEFSVKATALSLLPMTPVCSGVDFQGVHWPLKDAVLRMDSPTAISNRLAKGSDRMQVSLGQGILGVYCCWDESRL